MRFLILLIPVLVFFGCALTPTVNTRKAGQPWNYYGDLTSVYRDQTGGGQVALVWLDQVQFTKVDRGNFQKSVQTFLHQGYRKIGFVSVRSPYFVDPYEIKKLAADKGARLVVGCWFTAHETKSQSRLVDYWYQLLDKAGAPPPSVIPQAPLAPTPTPRPSFFY
jgi:hypothetical protein